jgi:site-specific DNA-methyltransferase (adenine-specific)
MTPQETSNCQPPCVGVIGSGDWLDPKIVNADCLIEMPTMPAQSVDCVMTDLPYGTTAAPWDSVLPLATLWAEWKRLLKPGGAIVLTASQPFSSVLGASNLRMLKYSWVWEKSKASNFLLARKQPLKAHEDILDGFIHCINAVKKQNESIQSI